MVSEISLDHDLGDDKRGTGYDIINFLEKLLNEKSVSLPKIYIHTMNSVAKERMIAGIQRLYSY